MTTKELTENSVQDSMKKITSFNQDEAYVGVLDIFGFEDMVGSSFY
jgi:myosin heavy subunit